MTATPGKPVAARYSFCLVSGGKARDDECGRSGSRRGSAGFLLPYAEIFAIPRAWRFSVAGDHRPDADVHVRARHGAADLRANRPLRRGRQRVGGRVARRRRCARRSSPGWSTGSASTGCSSRCASSSRSRSPGWRPRCSCARRTGRCSCLRHRSAAPACRRPARWPAPAGRRCWPGRPGCTPRSRSSRSADELCFVVGPAAVTLLATQVHPAAGVGRRRRCARWRVAVVRVAAVDRAAGRRPPAGVRTDAVAERPAGLLRAARRFPARRARPHRAAPVYLFLGAMFVSIDLSTVAFATQLRAQAAGRRASSAATRSAAAIGGLWYGSRNWHVARLAAARGHPGADRGRRVHVLGDAEPARARPGASTCAG